jgi:hypothetical protein
MMPRTKRHPDDQDNHLEFIFTDIQALEAIRFPSFVRDCRAIERPAQELFDALAQEKAAARAWVHDKHQELCQTFDPKITKLRRKQKIYIFDPRYR